jgi:putative Mg2+ transporter-C (MgtC) family protein
MITEVELTIVLRAVIAALLGFVIGREREVLEVTHRARTVALAAMTAASLVALTEAYYPDETARVVAGVVTGIGFLGAGTILKSSTGDVQGLTTAASLWAMSAIGLAVGSGHVLLGVLLTLVIYATIAISEWPALIRLRQVQIQRQAEAASGLSRQPPPASDASDDQPKAK